MITVTAVVATAKMAGAAISGLGAQAFVARVCKGAVDLASMPTWKKVGYYAGIAGLSSAAGAAAGQACASTIETMYVVGKQVANKLTSEQQSEEK